MLYNKNMAEVEPSYHEVASSEYWTDERIQIRLGELTLNLSNVPQPSGEYYAMQKEIDVLAFEQHMRQVEGS
jgi:hypothetical protein